ncbi:hypothetical protein EDB84DRAFT_433311 [Lactarius hengduanensis]|nr:hypothetical protein EDB84DRAFT_433311 [Lactarius hengduanensis]
MDAGTVASVRVDLSLAPFLGIVILAVSRRARPGTDIFHVATTWITAYFALTMTTNVLLSGAIALQVFLARNPVRGSRLHCLIIFTLVESCALYTYTLCVVAALTMFLRSSFDQYAAVDLAIVSIIVSVRYMLFLAATT